MTRAKEKKLLKDGYIFKEYLYDYDAQREQRRLEKQNIKVKLLRERTDTQGLKMYSVRVKKEA